MSYPEYKFESILEYHQREWRKIKSIAVTPIIYYREYDGEEHPSGVDGIQVEAIFDGERSIINRFGFGVHCFAKDVKRAMDSFKSWVDEYRFTCVEPHPEAYRYNEYPIFGVYRRD